MLCPLAVRLLIYVNGTGRGGSARSILVDQYPVRRPFEIVELPAVDGPPEPRADHEDEHQGQGDEQIEDVHAVDTQ